MHSSIRFEHTCQRDFVPWVPARTGRHTSAPRRHPPEPRPAAPPASGPRAVLDSARRTWPIGIEMPHIPYKKDRTKFYCTWQLEQGNALYARSTIRYLLKLYVAGGRLSSLVGSRAPAAHGSGAGCSARASASASARSTAGSRGSRDLLRGRAPPSIHSVVRNELRLYVLRAFLQKDGLATNLALPMSCASDLQTAHSAHQSDRKRPTSQIPPNASEASR